MSIILFFISLLFGVLYFALYNIGFALEKQAIDKFPVEIKENYLKLIKQAIKTPKWLFGFSLTIASIMCYFIALLWAPLTVIAPLTGFGLVILVIYSQRIIGEKLSTLEYIGILLVIVGNSSIGYFMSRQIYTVSWVEWNDLTKNTLSFMVIILIFFMLSITLALTFFLPKETKGLLFAIIAGISSGFQTIVVKGLSILIAEKLLFVLFGIFIIYLFIFSLTALGSTGGIQIALRDCKISSSMAVYNTFMIIIPVTYGGIALREWNNLGNTSLLITILSLIIVIVGVLIICTKHKFENTFCVEETV